MTLVQIVARLLSHHDDAGHAKLVGICFNGQRLFKPTAKIKDGVISELQDGAGIMGAVEEVVVKVVGVGDGGDFEREAELGAVGVAPDVARVADDAGIAVVSGGVREVVGLIQDHDEGFMCRVGVWL